MQIQLLRHATLVVTLKDIKLLVDPMLSPAGAMDPVRPAANDLRIPLVELPLNDEELRRLLDTLDAALVTHVHRDHWDARARELLRKDIPLFCQPGDETAIRDAGFTSVTPVDVQETWRGITFYRTGGQHGTGEIGEKMGHVSGFVLRAQGEPTLYIAGDTIWANEVLAALDTYKPDDVVVNAGAAQFTTGGPITMTAEHVAEVARARPAARVIAVHLEAVNHCGLTREALRHSLRQQGLQQQVLIPANGETIQL